MRGRGLPGAAAWLGEGTGAASFPKSLGRRGASWPLRTSGGGRSLACISGEDFAATGEVRAFRSHLRRGVSFGESGAGPPSPPGLRRWQGKPGGARRRYNLRGDGRRWQRVLQQYTNKLDHTCHQVQHTSPRAEDPGWMHATLAHCRRKVRLGHPCASASRYHEGPAMKALMGTVWSRGGGASLRAGERAWPARTPSPEPRPGPGKGRHHTARLGPGAEARRSAPCPLIKPTRAPPSRELVNMSAE